MVNYEMLQIEMTSLEDIMKEIDWDNDFEADLSDFEDHFPDLGDEELNISVSTTEIFEQCGHLFDLENTGCEKESIENSSEDDDETLSDLIPLKQLKNTQYTNKYWRIKDDFQFPEREWQRIDRYEAELEKLNKRPLLKRYFDYFPTDFLQKMAELTGRKAVESGSEICMTLPILLRFIAVTIRMNVYRLPSLKHYFSDAIGDLGAKKCLDRNTFFKIRRNIKCVWDSDIDANSRSRDPLWKVRPIMEKVRKCMEQIPCPPDSICVDEQIIPFTGGMPNKVVIKTKPHPVGLKLYCSATPSGTILNFLAYCGSKTFDEEYAGKPQGESAVLKLCDKVPKGCTVYLDRFFTGLGVVERLMEHGLFVTGTIQKNRLPKNLKDKILGEDAERGESRVLINQSETMALTCWKDSKVVLLLSSRESKYPEGKCKRWVKGQKSKKTFPQPNSVMKYNENMGGVDLMDRMLALYPHWGYKTKKWTVRVILHFFMMANVNIWFERGKNGRFFDHSIKLTEEMLTHALKLEKEMQIPSHSVTQIQPVPPPSARVALGHLPQHSGNPNASRCRFVDSKKKSCRGKSRWICSTCRVPLCLNEKRNCYKLFHE